MSKYKKIISELGESKLWEAEVRLRVAKKNLEYRILQLEEARARVLKEAGFDPEELAVTDYWKCENSPVGKCVYEAFEDPCHDRCIFCGDPEERK